MSHTRNLSRPLIYTAAAVTLILAAIVLPYVQHYRTQRALITDVEQLGGSVVLDPGQPDWLREMLPRSWRLCVDEPREIHLANARVPDDWLATLGPYSTVEMLDLANTGVGDAAVEHLSGHRNLKVLWLTGTRISDEGLARLDDLPELTLMYIDETAVTAAGVEEFRRRLPHVDVQW